MRTHQLVLMTLLLTFFLANNAKAQAIDSLKIIPTNPTTNNIVKVIIYTYSPNTPCGIDTMSFDTIDNQILVSVSPNFGIFPAICNSIDTFIIGILNAGNYELICDLGTDVPPVQYDVDTIIFIVQQANGLSNTDYSEQVINVYPNPVTSQINIDLKTISADGYDIAIYSVPGQIIKTIKTDRNQLTIEVGDLTEGIYYIMITDRNKRRWTKKIIKNAP